MRITIHVDDGVFDDLIELTAAKTRTEAVRLAVQEFIRMKRTEELLALRGRFDIENAWEDLRSLDTPNQPNQSLSPSNVQLETV